MNVAMNVARLNADYCATLVDEWVHQGLRHAVVAPGSRSAPLALALARDGRVALDVVLDERSAAFLALGIGRATGRPALVLCTSGTAATHFHAAVLEARYGAVPLLVVTADRPPELHGIGAPQTIEQHALYGDELNWSCDPGPPEPGAHASWRETAARAYGECHAVRPGPVHLNLAFREPLVGARGAVQGTPGAPLLAREREADTATVERITTLVEHHERGVIVAGWGAGVPAATLEALAVATGWPVLADAISNGRAAEHAVRRYEALVRVPELAAALRPDAVLRFGAALTSKVTTQWLADVAVHVVVDPHELGIDPTGSATDTVVADPEQFARALSTSLQSSLDGQRARGTTPWSTQWLESDRRADVAIDGVLDALTQASGPQVARDVAGALPSGAQLVVASSMPVRDLEWFAGPLAGVMVHANRGVNGIDGTIATATGIAIGTGAPTVAVMGDLAFLHDAGSLLGLADRNVDLTIVVVDNRGGGIFSFLAQHDDSPEAEFEQLFGTPQSVDALELARAYGLDGRRVGAVELGQSLGRNGTRVLVVPVLDRDADVVHHRDVWAAVAAAVLSDGRGAAAPTSAAART